MHPVRLTASQSRTVVRAIRDRDPQAEIYLFGSRINDEGRGGDIDLLVISKQIDLMTKLDILGEIHRRLGDRCIDLVVTPDPTPPFMRIAQAEGIRL
ncbi:nucleotidyltransferase domain-containing protein [Candidatus Thiosymbion oneisti]|nr:nucleotidyltransferase domain-containing protein [Candidatus Thiosymbion oneisti]